MSIHQLYQKWESCLHERSTNISLTDISVSREIVQNLVDTMRATNLVWIAAPQIGMSTRIFVTEIRHTPTRNPEEVDILRVYINPEIVSLSRDTCQMWEWCWSVEQAGVFAQVSRPTDLPYLHMMLMEIFLLLQLRVYLRGWYNMKWII
jgi:peptide deformylase